MYFSESEDLAPGVKYSDCQLQHEPSSETGFSKYFLQKCVCFKGARIFSFHKLLNTDFVECLLFFNSLPVSLLLIYSFFTLLMIFLEVSSMDQFKFIYPT